MIKVPLKCYNSGPVCSTYVLMWVFLSVLVNVTPDLFLCLFVAPTLSSCPLTLDDNNHSNDLIKGVLAR